MRASSTESSTASANTVSICFQRSFVIAGSLPAPHPRDGLVLGLPPQRDHAHISAYKQNTLYTVSTGIPFCRRAAKIEAECEDNARPKSWMRKVSGAIH